MASIRYELLPPPLSSSGGDLGPVQEGGLDPTDGDVILSRLCPDDVQKWIKAGTVIVNEHLTVTAVRPNQCDGEDVVGEVKVPRAMGLQAMTDQMREDVLRHQAQHGQPMRAEANFMGQLTQKDPPQQAACDALLEHVMEHGGAILQAPCGTGKTIMMVWLSLRLRRRCLWLCVRRNLLAQAVKAF